MHRVLDLYLIATRRDRYTLFGPTDIVEQCEIESGDRIRKFISWVMSRKNRVIAWVGRVLHAGHVYYIRLEDRIDPVERVLKAMACSGELTLHYAPMVSEQQARGKFQGILRKQRIKHMFWLGIDSVISAVVLTFTPILAPIPGPNVFFYYPVLRLLSHYRAIRGAASGLRSDRVQFKSLPELSTLEENLQAARFDRNAISRFAEPLKISGLGQFLERMV